MGNGNNNASKKNKGANNINKAKSNTNNQSNQGHSEAVVDTTVHCPYEYCPMDNPTKVNNLGTRCIYILIGWLVLGNAVSIGNAFYVSVGLYSWSLFMDYTKFEPIDKWRKLLKNIGKYYSALWCVISVIGVIGILKIDNINNSLYMRISETYIMNSRYGVQVRSAYFLLGITILLALLDWIAYESNIDKVLMKNYKTNISG
jgi:hypothetical protein